MTSGTAVISAGSAVVIFGMAPSGTIAVTGPWNSRILDTTNGLAVGDQLSAGGGTFNGAMSDTQTSEQWAMLIIELKHL